ncbi:MAG: hypothetical protein RJA22_1092 [Verrucomicrobiota bacterium]
MNSWRSTSLLLLVTGALLAFILLVERHWQTSGTPPPPPDRLLAFQASQVTNLSLHLTNQLLLRAERTNTGGPWQLTLPLAYPAHPHAIDALLAQLEQLVPPVHLTESELRSAQRTPAEFGLDLPAAKLTLQFNGQRREILFGNRTPVGTQVYVQVQHQPDVYTAPVEVLDRLPRAATAWRDPILIDFRAIRPSRFEVRAAGRGFTLATDPTNRTFVLTRPTPARADPSRVQILLQALAEAQVRAFVTDNPRADLEPFGLQPPQVELAIGAGTNDLVLVEFGRSPTNDTTMVYARRLAHTNVVLVPRTLLDTLLVPHNQMRDHHLMTFQPADIDAIEVNGAETFVVRRQTNGTWTVGEASPQLADPDLMKDWLKDLASLKGNIEADVVTDFKTPYGLEPPVRQYLLRASLTNGAGAISNRVVAELHLGLLRTNTIPDATPTGGDEVFARRPDEPVVYTLRLSDVSKLPYARWQLAHRRVWSFTTNQVLGLSATYRGVSFKLSRGANHAWNFAPGSQGVLRNPYAIEELVHRLGELQAAAWTARGEEARLAHGFPPDAVSLVIELKGADKPQSLRLEFASPEHGGRAPNGIPYALTTVGGEPRVFEFPLPLYVLLVRDLFQPLAGAGAADR